MRLLVAMVIALASVATPVSARPAEAATPVTTAPLPPPPKAWILVDGDTGNVIDANAFAGADWNGSWQRTRLAT